MRYTWGVDGNDTNANGTTMNAGDTMDMQTIKVLDGSKDATNIDSVVGKLEIPKDMADAVADRMVHGCAFELGGGIQVDGEQPATPRLLWVSICSRPAVDLRDLVESFARMTDDQRLEAFGRLMNRFCAYCGCVQPGDGRRCQCANDE